MENKIRLLGKADFKELLFKGFILPDHTKTVRLEITGAELKLIFAKKAAQAKRVYITFTDKSGLASFAFLEGVFSDENSSAVFTFDEALADVLNAKPYYRICMAVEYDNAYTCCFLDDSSVALNQDENIFAGTLLEIPKTGKKLAVYYSMSGRISVKLSELDEFEQNSFSAEISSVIKKDNGIEFSFNFSEAQFDEAYYLSKDKSCRIQLGLLNKTKTKAVCFLDFSDFSEKKLSVYSLVLIINNREYHTVWAENAGTEGFSVYEPIMLSNNNTVSYLLCKADSNSLQLKYFRKYYDYAFSIITAVYNTAPFIEETINSVLSQNIEPIVNKMKSNNYTVFGNAYELILVDDGSTDGSAEICDKFAALYPQIKVIHKENGGVSSARNIGMEFATGKYFNFLDSDDLLSIDTLANCFLFFEENYKKTNIVTFPMKFFDGRTGDHWMNYKFSKGSRIIDYTVEYDKTLVTSSASIFKADYIRKNSLTFDESLQIGEDTKFIFEIILNDLQTIGVVNTCTYWYRRRVSGEQSAIQTSVSNKNYYLDKLHHLLEWAFRCSKKKYGIIPRYVQYLVAQDIQWRFVTDPDASIAKSVLTDWEFRKYKKHIADLLKCIDSDIILEQKKIFREHKMYMLKLKYNSRPERYFNNNDVKYYFSNHFVSVASTSGLTLQFFKIENNILHMEGFNTSFEENQEFYICVNEEYICPAETNIDFNVYCLGDKALYSYSFVFDYPLISADDELTISFAEKICGRYIQKTNIKFSKFMPFNTVFSKSYYFSENWIANMDKCRLIIKKCGETSFVNPLLQISEYENNFIEQVKSNLDLNNDCFVNAIKLRQNAIYAKYIYSRLTHKKIWLISDRVNLAGDNGEAFFLYLQKINDPEIDSYFVINEDCADYERMKQYGKVVIQNSDEHKLLHLLADYIISAQADDYVFNPFSSERTANIFRDLLVGQKFIFLQHGITQNNLSGWLNRFHKNIYGFVTAAIPETQSILDYDYNYSKEQVWLTGFTRHDRLYDDNKNYITIMPTWRKYLTEASTVGINALLAQFKDSEFFRFYNSLLNNERFIRAARQYGYTICFMPHPNLMDNLEDFEHHPEVKFFGKEKPYREIYAESSLILTDYSSSVMDFAFLRKPVVYCQFDKEEFFSGKHTLLEGYYDYEKHGFGELTFNMEEAIDIIIDYMKNGCKLKPVYENRIDQFFAFSDKNSCKRLYEKIKSLDA